MKLYVEWMPPVRLKDGTRENQFYSVALDKLPSAAGVYVFGRRYGDKFEALYVGRAYGVRGRVNNQLNNLRLMQHIKKAKAGRRVVLAGRITSKSRKRIDRCLPLVEKALIRYFLSEGHDLVNKQGARLHHHELASSGKYPKRFIPRLIFLER